MKNLSLYNRIQEVRIQPTSLSPSPLSSPMYSHPFCFVSYSSKGLSFHPPGYSFTTLINVSWPHTFFFFFLFKSSRFLSVFTTPSPHPLICSKCSRIFSKHMHFFFTHFLVCAEEATGHLNGFLKAAIIPEEGEYWQEIQGPKAPEHALSFVQERGVLILQR